MILKTLIAIIGMSAVGWIAWRLVNAQGEPDRLSDENNQDASTASPPGSANDEESHESS